MEDYLYWIMLILWSAGLVKVYLIDWRLKKPIMITVIWVVLSVDIILNRVAELVTKLDDEKKIQYTCEGLFMIA